MGGQINGFIGFSVFDRKNTRPYEPVSVPSVSETSKLCSLRTLHPITLRFCENVVRDYIRTFSARQHFLHKTGNTFSFFSVLRAYITLFTHRRFFFANR